MNTEKKTNPNNKTNHVANHANPRHKGLTKAEKRLEARLADFAKIDLGKHPNYNKPGSLQ